MNFQQPPILMLGKHCYNLPLTEIYEMKITQLNFILNQLVCFIQKNAILAQCLKAIFPILQAEKLNIEIKMIHSALFVRIAARYRTFQLRHILKYQHYALPNLATTFSLLATCKFK